MLVDLTPGQLVTVAMAIKERQNACHSGMVCATGYPKAMQSYRDAANAYEEIIMAIETALAAAAPPGTQIFLGAGSEWGCYADRPPA